MLVANRAACAANRCGLAVQQTSLIPTHTYLSCPLMAAPFGRNLMVLSAHNVNCMHVPSSSRHACTNIIKFSVSLNKCIHSSNSFFLLLYLYYLTLRLRILSRVTLPTMMGAFSRRASSSNVWAHVVPTTRLQTTINNRAVA